MNVPPNVDVAASRMGAVEPPASGPGPGGSALRGWLVAGLGVGALDGLRAWTSVRAVPAEQLLSGAPTGPVDLALGLCACAARWLLVLLPFVLVGALVLRRRRTLVAAVGPWIGFGTAGAWLARLAWQSGLPVTSTPSLLLLSAAFAVAAVVALLVAPLVRRAPLRPLVVLAGLAAVVGTGWRATESSRAGGVGALNERNRDMPNVLFVVVDALRPDVLSIHGNTRAVTPNFERLAESGAVFDNAFTQAPYTWTSFGSFFTGKYPRRHGLMKMAPGVRLPENVTIASHLESGRLATGATLEPDDVAAGAFLMGALSHGSGLARGFDDICELMRGNDLIRSADRWSQFDAWTILGTIRTKLKTRLEPDLHVETARQWLAEHADRRFFAFVHLYSTHTPYDPPEPFRSIYVDPEYEGPIQSFYASHRQMIERGEYVPNFADQQQVFDLYMGGVSKADHDIGLLLDELEGAGVLDDTLVIISSDHGEDFGEGGRWEHNHMYRSNLQVPLIVSWPNGFEGGQRVEDLVDSIDVFPTVVEAAGLTLPEVVDEQDIVDGRSLLPRLRGEAFEPRTHSYAEDSTFVAISTLDQMLVLDRYAVKEDGWGVALDEGLGVIRFHDLSQDPLQRNELFEGIVRDEDANPDTRAQVLEKVETLRAELLAWDAHMPIDVEDIVRSNRDIETELNQLLKENSQAREDAQILIELGYMDGGDAYAGAELRARVLELRGESVDTSDDE